MSSSRRSTRTQTKRARFPGDSDDHYHANEFQQAHHEMNSAMGMMMGNMGMSAGGWPVQIGHHVPTEGYFNMGYQYQHTTGSYPHHQYVPQYGHQQYQQYQQYHHPVDSSQGVAEEVPGSSSGRSLRARTSGGGAATSNIAPTRGRKGGGGPIASTSATASNLGPPTASTQSAGKDVDDDDDDEEEAGTGTTTTTKSKNPHKVETTLTSDQMLQNCLYYLLLQQHKKVPVKRSDLIKYAMNSQHKQFSEIMKKLENILDDVFGMNLVQLGKGKDNLPCVVSGSSANAAAEEEVEEPGSSGKKGKGKGTSISSASYILVSKFPSSVFDSSMLAMARRDPEADSKKTVLYLVLATIFMLNQPIDEEIIWKIIKEMEFSQMVCKRRDELRKFLKSEYVSPGYLNMETLETQTHASDKHSTKTSAANEDGGSKSGDLSSDATKAKYSWGPRAHMEYSKYAMLKFVTARFPKNKMYEFTVQYNMVQRQEKDVIDRDVIDERDTDGEHDYAASTSVSGANGSALKIRQKVGGRGETYSIDGENTETETEGVE